MSTSSNPSTSAEARPSEGAISGTVQIAAALARQLQTAVAVLAGGSAAAGVVLWGLLWWPGNIHPFALILEIASFFGVLTPAIVLALFYQGLTDLLALPHKLARHSTRTAEESARAVQAVADAPASGLFTRLWRIVKQIWALRSVLLENRALLVRYGALVRFANPAFLLVVALAAVIGFVLIPGSLLAVGLAVVL